MGQRIAFLFALLLALCTTVSADRGVIRDGLWVTFTVGGQQFEAQATHPQTIAYVRSYVRGQQSPRKFCGNTQAAIQKHLDEWIQSSAQDCPWSAQIVRAHECRSGRCTPLKGMYSGRSPSL